MRTRVLSCQIKMTKVDSFVILGLETPHLQKFPFKTKVIYDKSFQNLAPSEKRGCVVVPAKSAPHVILFFTYFQYVSMPYHGPNSWFFLICPLVTVHMHTDTWVYNKYKIKFAISHHSLFHSQNVSMPYHGLNNWCPLVTVHTKTWIHNNSPT